MPYTPYQSTWNNPYLPVNGPSSAMGQSAIPAMQSQLATGWGQYQQPYNGTTQVSGPDSALQYGRRMPPNSTSPALFNTNGKVFYIVTTDGAGMPTLETFDFAPHVEEQPVQIDGAQFVSKQEYDQFVAKVSAALEAINGVHESVPTAGAADAAQGTDGAATLHDAGRPVSANLQPRTV